jgi:hypothetical protein
MGIWEQVERRVRGEWDALLQRSRAPHGVTTGAAAPQARARVPAASDVQGALRVLELDGQPSLAAVRAQYQRLARHYHPRTVSGPPDEAHAARVVVEALTEALEILEEHLLPLPASPIDHHAAVATENSRGR